MCAISGIIGQNPIYHSANLLQPMLAAMQSRGPDGRGVEVLPGYGCLGHNRLSIIDLHERAKQPIWDASQRYCLSFNGEIYNFLALRQELKAKGHQFRTESDSEVLIEAWAEWGVAAIDHLVGMFAFAVWDKREQQLFLVRDRMGEKPLYYAPISQNIQNGIVFASELKGLTQYPYISKSLSMTALSHYLSFNYTSTEDTIFQHIHKLPPACYLVYDLKTREWVISEYWSLAACFQQKSQASFADHKEQLNSLLGDAVKGQLVSDVPLGAFLSGGIDSASIVSQMRRQHADVNTYSIGFNEKTFSELPMSQLTAEHLGVKHNTKVLTSDVAHILPQLIRAFDEPFADSSIIPTYLLCAFAKEHVSVSLSGDGGDELFGGYVTYQADRYYQWLQYMSPAMRQRLVKLSRYLPTSFNKVSFDYKVKQFLRGSLLDGNSAHLSWREVFSHEQKQALMHVDFHDVLAQDSKVDALRWFDDVADCHYLDQMMYVDMKTWLVDDILVKVDRASMAHSLEVRAPFLDHRLVEFAARMPIHHKIQRHNGKRILKSSHAESLPKTVLKQPKRGFNSPISRWLSNDLFKMAHDVTTSSYLSQWFDVAVIKKMWLDHQKGVCDNGNRLFNLFCLGLWCESYLKE